MPINLPFDLPFELPSSLPDITIDFAMVKLVETSIIYTLLLVGYSLSMLVGILVVFALFNRLRYKIRGYKFDASYEPTFSVIVPAHNEENVLERTIEKFLKTSYPASKKEMIIVNDGSKDYTADIAEKYAHKVIDAQTGKVKIRNSDYKNIILINRMTGGKGKSYVLNDGRRYSSGEILFFIDADVQLSENIFNLAARHFSDERIGAVTGYIAVSEPKGRVLNKFINFEFTLSQKIMRLGFDTMGIHYIIPGGCGVFRRSVLEKVGDYAPDTLAEDTDMTWRVMTETKSKVHFDPQIKVIADEPTNLKNLWDQRLRWARGNFGVTKKHFRKIGRPKYGKAASLGYPFWISSIIIPLTFVFVTVGLLANTLFQVDVDRISIFARILSFAFFAIWILGVIVNKGKWWLAGLISPGFVMLTTLFSNMVFADGLFGLMSFIGLPEYTERVGTWFLVWILISLFATYPTVRLSRKHSTLGNIIQLGMFGYWGVLVMSAISGYFKEMRGDEMVWIRTVR